MKVSRKVGRRKHSRHSSISRRRFRNNKNKKSSYKKRYGKTHRGGCWSGEKKGGARSRKYGHKRGKRFHRGGVIGFDDEDIQPGTELPPTLSGTQNLDVNQLPKGLRGQVKIDPSLRRATPLSFEYKRTDGRYTFNPISETGVFDVVLSKAADSTAMAGAFGGDDVTTLQGIYLVRHDKNDTSMFDKYLSIPVGTWQGYNPERPFTGIKGYRTTNTNTNTDSSVEDGTYTFPPSDINQKSFQAVRDFITA